MISRVLSGLFPIQRFNRSFLIRAYREPYPTISIECSSLRNENGNRMIVTDPIV